MPRKGVFVGPVCYVGHDHEAADGRPLQGGWHYTVVAVPSVPAGESESPHTMPGEKLHFDSETGEYRLAKSADKSHQEKHHRQHALVANGGTLGEPRTGDEIEATKRHLDALLKRVSEEGLHPHEHDHIFTTPDEIISARHWLNTLKPEDA